MTTEELANLVGEHISKIGKPSAKDIAVFCYNLGVEEAARKAEEDSQNPFYDTSSIVKEAFDDLKIKELTKT